MDKSKNDLKTLKKKIYDKQVHLFDFMELNNIENYNDNSIKKYINEINLLNEIYDIKFEEHIRLREEFWKNT